MLARRAVVITLVSLVAMTIAVACSDDPCGSPDACEGDGDCRGGEKCWPVGTHSACGDVMRCGPYGPPAYAADGMSCYPAAVDDCEPTSTCPCATSVCTPGAPTVGTACRGVGECAGTTSCTLDGGDPLIESCQDDIGTCVPP